MQTRGLAVTVSAVFLVGSTIAFYWYSQKTHASVVGFGPDEQARVPIGQALIAGACLLCGILFGAVSQELQRAGDRVRIGELLRSVPAQRDLWRSLLGAPIIFAVVYTAARTHPDQVIGAIFAFQNGFFCKHILSHGEARHAKGNAGFDAPPSDPGLPPPVEGDDPDGE